MVKKVVVETGCRLHFTLIDMNADLGRVDGGIGVALKRPGWKVEVSRSGSSKVDDVARPIVEMVKDRANIRTRFQVKVSGDVPVHVGLGSQTQLSLAVATALNAFGRGGKRPSVVDLARLVERGGTSGIGVTAFERGGLILDGGHRYTEKGGFLPSRYSRAGPPPVLAHYQVPSSWFFVVAVPKGRQIFGRDEAKVFKDHTPIPRKEVGSVARLVLLRLLPSVMEDDVDTFNDTIKRIQGLGFKRVENRLQGKAVTQLQDYMVSRGAAGAGLSSFGPACFCAVRGRNEAQRLATDLKRYLKVRGGGKVFFSEVATRGARVKAD